MKKKNFVVKTFFQNVNFFNKFTHICLTKYGSGTQRKRNNFTLYWIEKQHTWFPVNVTYLLYLSGRIIILNLDTSLFVFCLLATYINPV